jgi:UDP-galactopyranose mutase
VLVVGAGWAGAVVARELVDAGVPVLVVERERGVGGHSRFETLNGVHYEPNGAHIFHTADERVARYVDRFGLRRPFEHRVLTEAYVDEDDEQPVLLSWPPQVEELRELPIWPVVSRELAELPREPHGEDFETWVISLMGPTLYRLFIEGYTRKQWGCEPSELSASLAPKRVELRDDGYTRLFRDPHEFFPAEGMNGIIEAILAPVSVECGVELTADTIDDVDFEFDTVIVTAPLDDFASRPGELPWRGIRMRSRYVPTELDGTVTATYVVNRPSPRVPYTRTVETKHATGQRIGGTVVSEEYPGAPARHYPVPTVLGGGKERNAELQAEITERLAPRRTFFCGRLATYRYINQDQAIADGLLCAADVLGA